MPIIAALLGIAALALIGWMVKCFIERHQEMEDDER